MTLPKPRLDSSRSWAARTSLEGEDPVDDRADQPALEPGHDPVGEPPGGGDLLLQRPGAERRARPRSSRFRSSAASSSVAGPAAEQPDQHEPAASGQRREVARQRGGAEQVDHRHRRPPRPVRWRTTSAKSSRVVSMPTSSPSAAASLQLRGGPRGAEDGAAHRVRELDRRRADAAADGVDQDPLARPDPGLRLQGVVRREEDLGDGRRLHRSRGCAGIGTAIRSCVTTYSA